MSETEPEESNGIEEELVYVAGRVREAKRIERILSEHDVEYSVSVVPFKHRVLGVLPVEYKGLGFYVHAPAADDCRRLLIEAGIKRGLVTTAS